VEYVVETVSMLVNRVPYEDLMSGNIKIVVYNAELPPELHKGISILRRNFSDLFSAGVIQVIENPFEQGFPQMVNLSRQHNATEKFLWRSKESLDFVRVLRYSQEVADYIVFLEDDVEPAWNYYQVLKEMMKRKFEDLNTWAMIILYGVAGNYGKVRLLII
jgi:hypothetical protein